MRLLPSSFVVLLVAVCRLSSGELVSWSYVDFYAQRNLGNESPFSLARDVKAEQYNKFVFGNVSSRQFRQLNAILGNTIYAMILDRLGKYETLPAYYKSALDNGVLCEVDGKLTNGAVRGIQYHADILTREQRMAEIEAARDPAIGIDCRSASSGNLDAAYAFCQQYSTLLYSAALKFKERIAKTGAERKTCEHELIDPLLAAISRGDQRPRLSDPAFFIASYLPDNAHDDFIRSFNSPDAPDRNAYMQCFADEPEAEAAVRALFAASALRWTLEGYLFDVVFKGAHPDIDSACAVESFKTSEVGRCACTKDTGISFCISKARAAYYKKIGYLTCTADSMSFNSSVRRATIPPFLCLSDSVAARAAPECEQYREAQ